MDLPFNGMIANLECSSDTSKSSHCSSISAPSPTFMRRWLVLHCLRYPDSCVPRNHSFSLYCRRSLSKTRTNNWSQLNNSKLQQTVTAVDTKSIWNKKFAIKFQITVKYITFEINFIITEKYLLYLQVHVLWNTLYLRSQNTTVANIINSHLLTLQLKILSISTTVHKLQCWVTVLLG